MEKVFRRSGLLAVLLLCMGSLVSADGVAVPTEGGVLVLEGRTLAEVRTVSLGEKEVPRLAVHPSSPVMAGLSGEQLIFWNLPTFVEASKHRNPLFSSVTSMVFSSDGSSLFLLSPELRAILKFDLATSKVTGTLPVPGGDPIWMKAAPDGLLVGQKSAVNWLSVSPEKGLLAQYSFPESVAAAVITQGRIIMARQGVAGLDSYELKSGRTIGFVPAPGAVEDLISGTGGLYALAAGGEVRALSPDASQARWTYPDSGSAFQGLLSGGSGGNVYCFGGPGGVLVSLDAIAGRENARVNLAGGSAVVPVVIPGEL